MSGRSILILYVGTFIIFAVFHTLSKSQKPFKRAFLSMLFGALSLIAVNISGIFTGVTLPISLLSVTTAIVGGMPGVTLMLALNMVLV